MVYGERRTDWTCELSVLRPVRSVVLTYDMQYRSYMYCYMLIYTFLSVTIV